MPHPAPCKAVHARLSLCEILKFLFAEQNRSLYILIRHVSGKEKAFLIGIDCLKLPFYTIYKAIYVKFRNLQNWFTR